MKKASIVTSILILLFISPFLLLMGLALLDTTNKESSTSRANWTTAPALIESSQIEKRSRIHKGRPFSMWCATISYGYASPTDLNARLNDTTGECFLYKSKADSLSRLYPPGKAIEIQINPENTEQTFFPEISNSDRLLTLATAITLLIGSAALMVIAVYLLKDLIDSTLAKAALIIACFIFIPASYIYYKVIDKEIETAKSRFQWSSTIGVIKSTHLGERNLLRGWCPHIEYTYSIIMTPYKGKKIMGGDWCDMNYSVARKKASEFVPGEKINVLYLIRRPSEAVLEPGVSSWQYMQLGASILTLAVFLGLAWRMFNDWARKAR